LWCPGERNDQSYTAIISGESTIEQRAVEIYQFDCFERLNSDAKIVHAFKLF
jgi:hypothetical protein